MKFFFIQITLLIFIIYGCSKDEEVTPELPNIVSISPNPTHGNFTIFFGRVYSVVKIDLYNAYGVLVESFIARDIDKVEANIQHPIGLYFIRLTHISGVSTTLKLVLN